MNRKNIIAEIRLEMGFRRGVWARVPGTKATFVSPEHEMRYKMTADMLEFFEALTDAEFYKIEERVIRRKDDANAQKELF